MQFPTTAESNRKVIIIQKVNLSSDAEEAHEKTQLPFMTISLFKVGTEMNYFSLIKGI
jgi:hypothetical protein